MSEADQIRKAKLLSKYSAMKPSSTSTTSAAAAGAGSSRVSKYASLRASTSSPPSSSSSTPMVTDDDQSSASSSSDNSPGSTTLGLGLGGGSDRRVKPSTKGPGLLRRPKKKPEEMGPPDTLLVEDIAVSRKIAEVAFKRAKYAVVSVGSGEEAVALFKKNKDTIKLVLMDIGLGKDKMSGIEAAKEIRAFETESKAEPCTILGLTGNFQEEDLAKYKEAKMNGCIAKGELLQKSVMEATAMLKKNPTQFVVLADVPTSSVSSPVVTPEISADNMKPQPMQED